VADRIWDDHRWKTPDAGRFGNRRSDIEAWLTMYSAGEPFVVLDDKLSGASFAGTLDRVGDLFERRVILCEIDVGLGEHHRAPILDALTTPSVAHAGVARQ
jgi:hypothetical protein